MSLTQRLIALVAVAILPVLATLVYFIAAAHNDRLRQVQELALRTSRNTALEMERIVTGAEGILETLAVAPTVRDFAPACDAYLGQVAERVPQLHGFAAADLEGRVRCVSGLSLAPEGVADQGWFREALRTGGTVVGEYTGTRPDDAPFLPVALPIRTGDRVTGVMLTGVDLAWLGNRLRERGLAEGNGLTVADRNGVIIAREPDPELFVGNRISDENMRLVRSTQPGVAEVATQDGGRRIIGYQPPAITATGLYVGAGFSTAVAFAPIKASTYRSLALAAGWTLAAGCLAALVGNRLVRRPIRRMLDTVAAWREGRETVRAGVPPGGDELSALAAAIDGYMDDLVADRAARRKAEERRALVVREMYHRIKNLLATVQAIANQTFKGRATTASLSAFGARLVAMGAAHDLLVSENWESAELRRTIETALAPFGGERESRFSLEGPTLPITPRAALALSMALHELCTNAAKYGALSVPGGVVAVQWAIVPAAEGDRFRLSWAESGGPPVEAPKRRGFGSRLIDASLRSEFGATVDVEFPPEGVRVALDGDAALILAAPDAGREATQAA